MENKSTKPNWFEGLGSDDKPALGFLETSSISRGIYLTDTVLKKAPVSVVKSTPVSSGKYVLLFFGDVASVEEAHGNALAEAAGCLVRDIFIPAVHPGLIPFLGSLWEETPHSHRPDAQGSIGIVESSSLAAAILAADRGLKTAEVRLTRFRLGQGIGGKAYFLIDGRLEAVEASLDASKECLEELESLCRVDLIARPQEDVLEHL